jgi:hypothetical protein
MDNSVRGDIFVDSEVFMVTSSILRFNPLAQSSGGAHKNRVCICVYRNECMRIYVSVCVVLCFF